METPCPYSPETAVFVTSSLEAWNRFFADGDSESDVDAAHEVPEESNSSTEESVDELLLSVLPTPSMPPKSDYSNEMLESVMDASYLDLAELVSRAFSAAYRRQTHDTRRNRTSCAWRLSLKMFSTSCETRSSRGIAAAGPISIVG